MTRIRLANLSKHFDQTAAVDRLNLDIAPGELFFLLGPSGCGKSTLLRLIAGLYEPDGGQIFFNDRDVTRTPTAARNAVMCFQSYALWPHLSVRENVRFGLKVRGASRAEQRARVDEVLRQVRMSEFADRRPNQLSGGQQQRVALARALAVEPACLLLDEPLSNLDAKLRHDMRTEIRRICKTSGLTTIYVTHDQKEALSVADRIAIMRAGRLAQVGTPGALYFQPQSSFVADFIGQTNLIRGKMKQADAGRVIVETDLGPLVATPPTGGDLDAQAQVVLCVRPEKVRVAPAAAAPGPNRIVGRLAESSFTGEGMEYVIQSNNHQLKATVGGVSERLTGDVSLEIDPADLIVLRE